MSNVQKKLESVNWDFASANISAIHGIHPYPARFIPELPRALISLFYQNDGSLILDPFCGSGTTLVEAANFGINSIGVDINPLACLISKVKVTPISGLDLINSLAMVVSEARKRINKSTEIIIPPIPNLDHWFKPHIQKVLACLTSSIELESDVDIRDALKVALSSIIVRVSNQESDTRYAAIEKQVASDDVFVFFSKAVHSIAAALRHTEKNLFASLGRATVLHADILQLESQNIPYPVGLVVTSPPYPNAYEYWLYHKYRMYWLGMDPLTAKSGEIGARPHYFKKNHYTEETFERQMGHCFSLLAMVMKPKARACFLIGRSIIHGRRIDNVCLLESAAKRNGFTLDGVAERKILITRKAFNPIHGGIDKECVAVFSLINHQ